MRSSLASKKIFILVSAFLLLASIFWASTQLSLDNWSNFALVDDSSDQSNQSDFVKAITTKMVFRKISKEYYDQSRIDARNMLDKGLQSMSNLDTDILFHLDDRTIHAQIGAETTKIKISKIKHLADVISPLQKCFSFVEKHYRGKTEFNEFEYAAINGMLEALDPHSAFFTPKMFNDFRTQTEGEFGGLGIVIGIKEGELTVIAPIPDTPAARAGILSNDKIIQIDDQSTINMNINDAVELMRGKVGTFVTITVNREARAEPFALRLKRAIIKIESVQSKLLSYQGRDIAYAKVKSFAENTTDELRKQLKQMRAQAKNFSGLILDLRGNPGGLLDQAIQLSDLFIENGTIVLTVGINNQIREIDQARAYGTEDPYPMIVLIDEGSASASEIVAGALKNNNRALIVGQQSFGKGSVQTIDGPYPNQSAMKFTIAQYLTPGNQSIQSVGISPDIRLVPAQIAPNFVKLLEPQFVKEKDLDGHLNQLKNEDELTESKFTLTYFDADFKAPSDNPDQDEAALDSSEYDPLGKTIKTYPVIFAQELLANYAKETRSASLEAVEEFLVSKQNEENKNIAAKLSELGIDWTPVDSQGDSDLYVSYSLLDAANKEMDFIQAGQEAYIELKAKNTGRTDIQQVVARIASKNYRFKNLEFPLGTIKAGATATYKRRILTPKLSFNRFDRLRIEFFTRDKLIQNAGIERSVTTVAAPEADLAMSYKIHDDGSFGSQGNGNGMMEAGESIALTVDIFNQSDIAAGKSELNLKNESGQDILIKQGRIKFNSIAARSQHKAQLLFQIDKSLETKELELLLGLNDKESNASLTLPLSFPLAANNVAIPQNTKLSKIKFVLSDEWRQRARWIVHSKSELNFFAKLTHALPLLDVTGYVDSRKVMLKYFDGRDTETNFSLDSKLTPNKSHVITIIARDQFKIPAQYSFVVDAAVE